MRCNWKTYDAPGRSSLATGWGGGGVRWHNTTRNDWSTVRAGARAPPIVFALVVCRPRLNADVSAHVMWMCCVVLRMRGEAGGARGKAGVRTSGSNYPPISAAYWLPPSNPTPYHVPGSMIIPHSCFKHVNCDCIINCRLSTRIAAVPSRADSTWRCLSLTQSTAGFYEWRCNRVLLFFLSSAIFFHPKRKACLTLTDMPTEKQYVSTDARLYNNSVEIKWHSFCFKVSFFLFLN